MFVLFSLDLELVKETIKPRHAHLAFSASSLTQIAVSVLPTVAAIPAKLESALYAFGL